MSRRWKIEEDTFIVTHYCIMLEDLIANHDIGCTLKDLRNRVKHLKRTGAWDILRRFVEEKAKIDHAYHMAMLPLEAETDRAYLAALSRKIKKAAE